MLCSGTQRLFFYTGTLSLPIHSLWCPTGGMRPTGLQFVLGSPFSIKVDAYRHVNPSVICILTQCILMFFFWVIFIFSVYSHTLFLDLKLRLLLNSSTIGVWVILHLIQVPGPVSAPGRQAGILTHCLVPRDFVGGIEKLGLFVE